MMLWMEQPLILKGKKVVLRPLEEAHFDELLQVAKDARIWEFYSRNVADDEVLMSFLNEGLRLKEQRTQYPFTVFNKDTNKVIGTTRLGDIQQLHHTLEIGWTWYVPEVWGKGYNEECKLLLLTHCFEQMEAIRVQLKTSHINRRSQQAIQRIGATFEGVLRNHMINPDGSLRDTYMYSIIKEEWPDRKEKLRQMMNEKYALL